MTQINAIQTFNGGFDDYLSQLRTVPGAIKREVEFGMIDARRRTVSALKRVFRAFLTMKAASINRRIKTPPISRAGGGKTTSAIQMRDPRNQAPLLSSLAFRALKSGIKALPRKIRHPKEPPVWKHAFVGRNTRAADPDNTQRIIFMPVLVNGKRVRSRRDPSKYAVYAMRGPSFVGLAVAMPGFGEALAQIQEDTYVEVFNQRRAAAERRALGGQA